MRRFILALMFSVSFISSASAQTGGGALIRGLNLSDVPNKATARANLGVTGTGVDTTYNFRANNLSDVANAATARGNLGVTATGADTAYNFRANNLSDVASAATALHNLGVTVISVKNAGATGDCVTNDRPAIQAALNALTAGQALYFPATGSGCYLITGGALTLPVASNVVIFGDGIRASRIKQGTSGNDVIDSNNVWATSTNGVVLRDLWIDCNGIGRYGINWKATNRSYIRDVRVQGCDDVGSAGIRHDDSIVVTMRGIELDGNYDGIIDGTGANSPPNAFDISATIENSVRYGINVSSYSGSRIWCACEANLKGGIRINGDAEGVTISGYFEGNRDGSAGTFDVYVGIGTYVRGVTITGSQFLGHASDSNYYPIRVKYADGIRIDANNVSFGSRFINFEAGGAVTRSTFGAVALVNGTPDRTTGVDATFGGIDKLFVYRGNRITAYNVIPSDGQNYFSGTFNAASVSTTLGAGSTWTDSATQNNGRATVLLVRTVNTSLWYKGWTVSANENQRARGNWITFMVDVQVATTVKLFTLDLSASAGACTQQFGLASTDGTQTVIVNCYFAGTITSLQALMQADDNNSTFRVSNARLFVGLDAVTMPGNSQ